MILFLCYIHRIVVLEKLRNVLEMFWNFFKFLSGHPDCYFCPIRITYKFSTIEPAHEKFHRRLRGKIESEFQ